MTITLHKGYDMKLLTALVLLVFVATGIGCATTTATTPTSPRAPAPVKIMDGGCDRETSYGVDLNVLGFELKFFLKAKCETDPEDKNN